MRFGQDYHAENLFWSGAKILNSCSPRLGEKLEENANNLRLPHRTGPVYLVMLYQVVLSSTPVSMRAVTRRLESLKLGDFDGENVKNAVSLIRGAIGLLQNNNALPPDIVDIIFRIMKTSSTADFNTPVSLMRSNHDLNLMRMTVDQLVHELQKKYNELALDGQWEVGVNDGQHSVFFCFSCGREGHM